jgi:hypothetical protein
MNSLPNAPALTGQYLPAQKAEAAGTNGAPTASSSIHNRRAYKSGR